jgi:hypothetical protein
LQGRRSFRTVRRGPEILCGKLVWQPCDYDWWLTHATMIEHLRRQCKEHYGSLVTFEDGYALVGWIMTVGGNMLDGAVCNG